MNLKLTRLTVAMLVVTGFSMSALADGNPANIFTGDVGNSTSRVKLFMPTQNTPPVDVSPNREFVVVYKTRTRVEYVREHETRAERRKRAIGHRYLGFKKQYRGYKYPF